MLERQIVNRRHHRTWRKRWRGELHVQYIDRMPAQLGRQRQRNPHQRRVRERLSYFEIGPAIREPIDGGRFGYGERVEIALIDLGQTFDQVDRVTFVAGQLRSDRMRVDCDVQDRSNLRERWPASPKRRGTTMEAGETKCLFFSGLGFATDSGRSGCVSQTRVALTNARRLAAQSAQVIKLGAPDMAALQHVDGI